jgi:phosphoribosylamine--glycine ligase
MRVLLVGGGGREHAIAWKLKKDNPGLELFCAPGNAGIEKLAQCRAIPANDLPRLLEFAREIRADLTIVGPEEPLTMGIADLFAQYGLKVFGPNKSAARLEGSKAFAKGLMRKYNIPTADYHVFDTYEAAYEYVSAAGGPLVVKADGLAAGKGVTICRSAEDAYVAIYDAMRQDKFGSAGRTVVIEEMLTGPEVSVLAFTDGQTIMPMVSAQDHKRAYNGGRGPNTGGMGAFSPSGRYTPEVEALCVKQIIEPTLAALRGEGIDYRGIIYFGLMLTDDGPKVIEYNCRFGDPETQVVLPRLHNNLLGIMLACAEGRLDGVHLTWNADAAAFVTLVSDGYPGAYKKGLPITGLAEITENSNTIIFHAGTAVENGQVVTAGGRVLGVTALSRTVAEAAGRVYEVLPKVRFEGARFRNDIGKNQ